VHRLADKCAAAAPLFAATPTQTPSTCNRWTIALSNSVLPVPPGPEIMNNPASCLRIKLSVTCQNADNQKEYERLCTKSEQTFALACSHLVFFQHVVVSDVDSLLQVNEAKDTGGDLDRLAAPHQQRLSSLIEAAND